MMELAATVGALGNRQESTTRKARELCTDQEANSLSALQLIT